MRRFKVLLVVPLHRIAGAEVSTLFLAKGLKERGHQVTVLCNNGPLMGEFEGVGVRLIQGMVHIRSPWGILKGASEIRKCLMQEQIEIVHVQNAFLVPMAFLASRRLGRRRVSLIWHCRGIKNISYPIAGHLFNYLLDFVIANCEAERKRLVDNGLNPRKTRTIYNCLNMSPPNDIKRDIELLKELGIETNSPVVATVSTLIEQKGINFFLEAAIKVSEEVPQAKFLIVGHGPLEEKLKMQARGLGIEDKTIFLGARRDMERVYSIIDVLAVPSVSGEATNNPVAEAMVFTKPVVATNIGGIPEIVKDGHTGILVPPKDSKKLAQAILYLLRNEDFARKMGLAGRERVMRDFTLERLVREVEQVYSQVSPLEVPSRGAEEEKQSRDRK